MTVIIPCYNGEDWVELAVRSALAQTYRHLEVIVVDDGSSDSSSTIVRQLAEADSRLQLVVQENQGVGAARNHGIRLAKGEYIAPLDHDDVWSPEKIEKQLNCMLAAEEAGETVGLVYCWSEIIDEEGRIIRKGIPRKGPSGRVFNALLVDNFMGNGSTPLVRTELAREVGGYQEASASGCEDWVFDLMLAYISDVAVVEEYLVGYRQFERSMSHNTEKMLSAHDEMIQVLRENFESIPSSAIRDSRTAMRLWMLYRSPLFSPSFNQMLRKLFHGDVFFWARGATLRKLYWMFYVRVFRFIQRLKKEDLSGDLFKMV